MQSAYPLVSIIAISYNQEEYVEATLNSIKNQTYPNIQLIISDDGSKDRTKEIISTWVKTQYPHAIFLNNNKNAGITKNLNRAIPYIKGSFVKQIGCDDILTIDSVSKIMGKFAELPIDYGVVYTNMSRINEKGDFIDDRGIIETRGHKVYSGYVYKEMIKKPFITSASIIFRKEVLDKLKCFNEKVFYEDHDFYLRASRFFKFCYLDEKLVNYRVHSSSLINSSSRIKYFINQYFVYITSYDNRKEFKEIYIERLLFCIKNLYYNKFKSNFFYGLRAFFKTGRLTFLKFAAASVPFMLNGRKK
ncbi:MAG TPA: glycosyltransferase [Chitinophagaceae bacterium]|nr:glycosyltransferase [Chitinophagaceae bacterium]